MSHLTVWQNALVIIFSYLVYKRRRSTHLNLYMICINCLGVLLFSWQLQHWFVPDTAIYHLLLSLGAAFGVALAYQRVGLSSSITIDYLSLPANTQLGWLLILGIILLAVPMIIAGLWLDMFDCLAMLMLGSLSGWVVAKDICYWLLVSSHSHAVN